MYILLNISVWFSSIVLVHCNQVTVDMKVMRREDVFLYCSREKLKQSSVKRATATFRQRFVFCVPDYVVGLQVKFKLS